MQQMFLVGNNKLKSCVQNDLLNIGRAMVSLDDLPKKINSNSFLIDCRLKNTLASLEECISSVDENSRVLFVFNDKSLLPELKKVLYNIKIKLDLVLVPDIIDSKDSRLFNLISNLNEKSFEVDVNEFVHLALSSQVSESITDIINYSYLQSNSIITIDTQNDVRLIDAISFMVKRLGINHDRLDDIFAESPMVDKTFYIKKTNLFNTQFDSKDALSYCIYLYKNWLKNE